MTICIYLVDAIIVLVTDPIYDQALGASFIQQATNEDSFEIKNDELILAMKFID